MSNEQAQSFLDQAKEAIQAGQFAAALPLADQCLALDPSNSEAYSVRGVALSQTNQPEEAVAAFRSAIELQPTAVKPHFNLAVHLYGLGRKEEALGEAQAALGIEPGHAGARDLVVRIQQEMGTPGASVMPPMESGGLTAGTPTDPNASADYYRPGYENPATKVHSVALVEKMGSSWVYLGWAFCIIGIIVLILTIPQQVHMIQVAMSQDKEAMRQAQMASMNSGRIIIGLLSYLNIGLALVWMIMDIMDRRGNFVWLAPWVIACCCLGLYPVVQGIYILTGRK
jgi:tetratricopeptide (TPR) repeat protein